MRGLIEGDMASFFFHDDDARQGSARPEFTHDAHQAPDAAPRHLKSVRCGPLAADSQSGDPSSHGQRRAQVAPPSLFINSSPIWRAWATDVWRWLWDLDETPRQPAPTTGLRRLKSEFASAMWDLQSLRAHQVRQMIEQARSLRELWHLRADVFRVISVHRGQVEAQQRLDTLDGHFPVRSHGRSERSGRVTRW
jgi:hypothetical protein